MINNLQDQGMIKLVKIKIKKRGKKGVIRNSKVSYIQNFNDMILENQSQH